MRTAVDSDDNLAMLKLIPWMLSWGICC